jgi:putative membrane protein
MYSLFKTIHVIGFVSWFAGLFYLGRMFVYHAEALTKDAMERKILTSQLQIMEQRVYSIILNPAMMITWTCGLSMIYMNGWNWWVINIWMHFKFGLLLLLTLYQIKCKKLISELIIEKLSMSSHAFRLFNEIPTLFLILIATLAVYKNTINLLYLMGALFAIIVLLLVLTNIYKKHRLKKSTHEHPS